MNKRRDLDEVYGLEAPGQLVLHLDAGARPYTFDCFALAFAKMEVVRIRARRMVADALRYGKLTRPDTCERCRGSEGRIESHHADYARPLEVTWYCVPCHKAESKRIAALAQSRVPDARGFGGPGGGSLARVAARAPDLEKRRETNF